MGFLACGGRCAVILLSWLQWEAQNCGVRPEKSLMRWATAGYMIRVVCFLLFQKIKATVVWTCTLAISLFVESCHTHKVKLTSYSHFPLVSCTTPSYQSKLLSSLSAEHPLGSTVHDVLEGQTWVKAQRSLSAVMLIRGRTGLNYIHVNLSIMSTFITLHIVKFPNLVQMY